MLHVLRRVSDFLGHAADHCIRVTPPHRLNLCFLLSHPPLFSLCFFQVFDRRRLANQGVTWRVSASPHFSRRKTNTEKRERGGEKRGKRSPRRICSWQLFQQPILIGCNFVPQLLCFVLFLTNRFLFLSLMWDLTAVLTKKEKKKKTALARVLLSTVDSEIFFSFFFFYKFNDFFFPPPFPRLWVAGAFRFPLARLGSDLITR